MSSLREMLCRWFGHKFDYVDAVLFDIERNALNAANLTPEITCQRCKHTFIPRKTKT